MRHVGTLLAALVIAPMVWILLAFGQDRSATVLATAERTGVMYTDAFVRPLQFLAVAGLLVGLITTLRFSPAGALLMGIIYVSSYTSLLVAPKRVLDLIGHDLYIAGRHADPSTPVRTGTTLVLGALLLVWAVGASRWRSRPSPIVPARELIEEPFALERPLGADGLGLTPAGRAAADRPAAGRTEPGRTEPGPTASKGAAPRSDLKPEVVVRYRTSPRSADRDSDDDGGWSAGRDGRPAWAGPSRRSVPYGW
jgi:hypothetical protein